MYLALAGVDVDVGAGHQLGVKGARAMERAMERATERGDSKAISLFIGRAIGAATGHTSLLCA